MEYRAETSPRRIAIHCEHLIKIGQLENRGRGQGLFESGERCRRLLGPGESLLLEEGCQRCCNGAVVLDEPAVVAGEAEEPPEAAHGPGCGQLATAATLSWSIATPSPEMMCPK